MLKVVIRKFFYVKSCIKRIVLMSVFAASATFVQAGAFDKGVTTGTLSIGSAQIFTEDYLIIGLGVGHYVIDGLELGLDVDVWSGGEPSIYEVSPRATYVVDNLSDVKPYFGVFFNRAFIENQTDSDSLGYRAGFYSPVGRRSYVGIGLVNTELQDCTETVSISCSDTYSEITFVFSL